MTDRYNYLTVALERDTRDDDAEALIAAIRQLRGVMDVQPNIADAAQWLAEERARRDLGQKILEIVYPKQTGA